MLHLSTYGDYSSHALYARLRNFHSMRARIGPRIDLYQAKALGVFKQAVAKLISKLVVENDLSGATLYELNFEFDFELGETHFVDPPLGIQKVERALIHNLPQPNGKAIVFCAEIFSRLPFERFKRISQPQAPMDFGGTPRAASDVMVESESGRSLFLGQRAQEIDGWIELGLNPSQNLADIPMGVDPFGVRGGLSHPGFPSFPSNLPVGHILDTSSHYLSILDSLRRGEWHGIFLTVDFGYTAEELLLNCHGSARGLYEGQQLELKDTLSMDMARFDLIHKIPIPIFTDYLKLAGFQAKNFISQDDFYKEYAGLPAGCFSGEHFKVFQAFKAQF